MKHPPMKRHISLEPLSRDHYAGLVQARRMKIAAAKGGPSQRLASLTDFVREWNSTIAAHLADEERLLVDLIGNSELTGRMLAEHDQLRRLATEAGRLVKRYEPPDAQWLNDLGCLLHDHIRWEERSLFPAIEQQADSAQLAQLAHATEVIENQRPRWDRAPNPRASSSAAGAPVTDQVRREPGARR